MVIDVPTADDFRAYGLRYLNLGWGAALRIAIEIIDLQEYDSDKVLKSDFIKAAEPELATALSLVEQGVEFLLKSRIATVSPWLLISRNPDGWPRRCDKEDVPFAEFHILDAQDLVKVHDTVAAVQLPGEFTEMFRELRRKRNAMMHTVDPRIKASIAEIMEHVLLNVEILSAAHSWPEEREKFLATTRDSTVDADLTGFQLAREFGAVIEHLPSRLLKRFLGFSKKRRSYLCPICSNAHSDAELECRSAVLEPNTPDSISVYCFVCRQTSAVTREPCTADDCKGNVIDVMRRECLTCGARH